MISVGFGFGCEKFFGMIFFQVAYISCVRKVYFVCFVCSRAFPYFPLPLPLPLPQ